MIPGLEIERLTKKLRSGEEPMWRRIRQLLITKGVEPINSILAYFAQEDPFYEFGVIVSGSGEVYQFGFDYLQKDILDGVFAEWKTMTDEYQTKPYCEDVRTAIQILKRKNIDS